jgi:hypothetical protein
MTYNEAYNKIIEAYFKDEIKPNDMKFCFCGTLANNSTDWYPHLNYGNYTGREYKRMEAALFKAFPETNWGFGLPSLRQNERNEGIENYEEKLFAGMSAALDVLKQIHIERGEVIDETPVFTKRQLV